MPKAYRIYKDKANLTSAELSVLGACLDGLEDDIEFAKELGVSVYEIQRRFKTMRKKLGTRTRLGCLARAFMLKIVVLRKPPKRYDRKWEKVNGSEL